MRQESEMPEAKNYTDNNSSCLWLDISEIKFTMKIMRHIYAIYKTFRARSTL